MQYYACIIHYLLFTFYLLLILSTILINIYSLIIFITLEKFLNLLCLYQLFIFKKYKHNRYTMIYNYKYISQHNIITTLKFDQWIQFKKYTINFISIHRIYNISIKILRTHVTIRNLHIDKRPNMANNISFPRNLDRMIAP